MPICKYCNKTLSTIAALNVHQQKAKYCLNIRNNAKTLLNLNSTPIDDTTKEIEGLRSMIANRDRAILEKDKELDTLREVVADKDRVISEYTTLLDTIKSDIVSKLNELEGLRDSLVKKEAEVKEWEQSFYKWKGYYEGIIASTSTEYTNLHSLRLIGCMRELTHIIEGEGLKDYLARTKQRNEYVRISIN